jgi:hypothetical protein
MNINAWVGQLTAPVGIALGILTCFWGYRILKLTLGIMGFLGGASGGWAVGLSLAPGNSAIALVCAVVAGIVGAALCIWLFFLGIFLLGASAGAVVAAAFLNASGNQPQPILVFAFAVVFGVIALVMQKFMIIISTAFSGSYLLTAGIFHLFTGGPNLSPLWFEHPPSGAAGMQGYVALGLWVVLGLGGLSFQYRGSQQREEAVRPQTQVPK